MGTRTHIYQEDLGAIISFKPEITYNTTRTYKGGKKAPDGIELRFGTVRPTPELREKLKAHGFQFSERQVMWYALDNAKSRELIEYLETNDVQADDTQLEKRYLWAKVGSMDFYDKLRPYTEFMVKGAPNQFFKNKKQLEKAVTLKSTIYGDLLSFKKFYNRKVGEEDGDEGNEEKQDDEDNENDDGEDNDEDNEYSPKTNSKSQKQDLALAAKLKDLADSMEKTIQAKLNSATSRQRPTAKRLRVAAGMREEGYYLQNIQRVLYALSSAYEKSGMQPFSYLKNIRTKSQVELLNKYADIKGKKHEDHYLQSVLKNHFSDFKTLGISTVSDWGAAFLQKDDLMKIFLDPVNEHDRKMKQAHDELEMKIKGMKIPGFFPTPKTLIQKIIPLLDVKKGMSILEPSAGKGDILDALREQYSNSVQLSACEIHYDLRKFLELKGYNVVTHDFLNLTETYDRIIMNPPFEKGIDIDHVNHALSLLNRNGRLVAIMGEGSFIRSNKKEKTFRDMLFEQNAFVSEPIKNAFKDAFNQTGITVRIVVIKEDGSHPDLDSEDESEYEEEPEEDQDDKETLELEALAQMELLKMEIELKKKKQNLNGLGHVIDTSNYPEVWDIH